MTITDALRIREWRVENGCSWRRVAELAAEEWPEEEYAHGHQLEGRDLCEMAMTVLEENWEDY